MAEPVTFKFERPYVSNNERVIRCGYCHSLLIPNHEGGKPSMVCACCGGHVSPVDYRTAERQLYELCAEFGR